MHSEKKNSEKINKNVCEETQH